MPNCRGATRQTHDEIVYPGVGTRYTLFCAVFATPRRSIVTRPLSKRKGFCRIIAAATAARDPRSARSEGHGRCPPAIPAPWSRDALPRARRCGFRHCRKGQGHGLHAAPTECYRD